MEYYIHTLTSLHIGSGEKYSAHDYFLHNNRCYFVPSKLLFDFLSEHQLAEKYAQWMNKITHELEKLEELTRIKKNLKNNTSGTDYNQILQNLRSKMNLLDFCKENQYLNEFQLFLNKLPFENYARSVRQGYDILANVKSFNGSPFIPASSVKGAVRTALLFKWLNQFADKNHIHDILIRAIKKTEHDILTADAEGKRINLQKLKVDFGEELEKVAFYCPFFSKDDPGKISHDEKFDILKFLILSDATPLENNNPAFHIIKPQLFLSNGTVGKQAPALEAVLPRLSFKFSANINLHAILNIKKNFTQGSLVIKEKNKHYHYWNHLSEKCQQFFNFSPDILLNASPDVIQITEQRALEYVFNAVRDFSVAQSEFLLNWKKNIAPDKQSKFQTFNPESILLPNPASELTLMNLGYASGFPATTAFLFLLNNHEFHDLTTEFFKLFKIGHPPKENKKFVFNLKKFPKSKMLYTDDSNNQSAYPLGWVCISSHPDAPSRNTLNSVFIKSSDNSALAAPVQITYFTGKIKEGTELFAKFIKPDPINPKIKHFQILTGSEGQEPYVKISYAAELSPGSVFLVKVTSVSKSGIQSVQIVKKIV